MNERQKKHLRRLGHPLHPLVTLGQAGLTDAVAAEMERALADHELVKARARLEGKEIAEFTMHENIDNMEGLSLRRTPDGKTLLYMISDDNYDHLKQRTVLLMFELAQ